MSVLLQESLSASSVDLPVDKEDGGADGGGRCGSPVLGEEAGALWTGHLLDVLHRLVSVAWQQACAQSRSGCGLRRPQERMIE